MQYAAALTPAPSGTRRAATPRRGTAHIAARLALGALLLATLLVAVASLAHTPSEPIPDSWGRFSVSANSTLWDIAEAHPIDGRSTAETVDLIAAENGLVGATIHAGQVLRVPGSQPAIALAQR